LSSLIDGRLLINGGMDVSERLRNKFYHAGADPKVWAFACLGYLFTQGQACRSASTAKPVKSEPFWMRLQQRNNDPYSLG
jgi:hypothetical protein